MTISRRTACELGVGQQVATHPPAQKNEYGGESRLGVSGDTTTHMVTGNTFYIYFIAL